MKPGDHVLVLEGLFTGCVGIVEEVPPGGFIYVDVYSHKELWPNRRVVYTRITVADCVKDELVCKPEELRLLDHKNLDDAAEIAAFLLRGGALPLPSERRLRGLR